MRESWVYSGSASFRPLRNGSCLMLAMSTSDSTGGMSSIT